MANKKKVDNGAVEAKVELRKWAIAKLGGASNCSVMDLYAGGGEMYDHVYKGVKEYRGFELRGSHEIPHPAGAHVLRGDNRVLWSKMTGLWGYNLIDSDAYGTPWVLLNDVAKNHLPGKFAVTITDGQFRTLQTGNIHGFTRQVIGYESLPDNGLITQWRDEIVQWHINDWAKYGVKVLEGVESKSIDTKVFYYGFVCKKGD